MARKLKITVDHDVCVGNAMCETFATHTFALNADRQSEAVKPAGTDSGSGGQLPGKRNHRRRRGNRGKAVAVIRSRQVTLPMGKSSSKPGGLSGV